MASPAVEILHCSSCGAPVPLGAEDEARCLRCGQAVPLPEAHRELRRLQQVSEASRREAQRLFASMDSPPSLFTRVVAAVFDQPALAFWIFFGVPVGLMSIFAGLAIDDRYHPPPAVTTAVIFVALFGFTFLPRSLGIYANRRASGRRVLLAGLAARPPKMSGGPAGCRECGAPLEVPDGAVVARCGYCGADSAVRIRTPFLLQAKRHARAAVHTIEEAVAIDGRERAETRAAFTKEFLRYFVTTSIFGVLFALFMWDDARAQARGDDSAPAIGITALVVGTFLLIGLMLRSAGGSDERTKEEARARRDGHGLPEWVRFAGPIGFWIVLWLIRFAIWH